MIFRQLINKDSIVTSTEVVLLTYKRISKVSNPDEFDINILVTPGIIHEYHNSVTNHGISKVEDK